MSIVSVLVKLIKRRENMGITHSVGISGNMDCVPKEITRDLIVESVVTRGIK